MKSAVGNAAGDVLSWHRVVYRVLAPMRDCNQRLRLGKLGPAEVDRGRIVEGEFPVAALDRGERPGRHDP